ncbi:hypothetical protein M5D96_002958 [Drosophila gunungcola]|uniref:Uncharacterized protein n=1 Tax=Drosophila gunungcola TaxID=103775 RepID=A0A9Q0BWV5_9MUSC|nr:hypothetical protein M5D96_002958 [Drosophila gunungcola]
MCVCLWGRAHRFCLASRTCHLDSRLVLCISKIILKSWERPPHSHIQTCVCLCYTHTVATSPFYSCSAAGRPAVSCSDSGVFIFFFFLFFLHHSCYALPRSLAFCLTWGRFHFLAGGSQHATFLPGSCSSRKGTTAIIISF